MCLVVGLFVGCFDCVVACYVGLGFGGFGWVVSLVLL